MPTKRNKTGIMMYLERGASGALYALSKRMRIPRAVLVREAIDDLLKKYRSRPKRGRDDR